MGLEDSNGVDFSFELEEGMSKVTFREFNNSSACGGGETMRISFSGDDSSTRGNLRRGGGEGDLAGGEVGILDLDFGSDDSDSE